MYNSHLVHLLKGLSNTEIHDLLDFINLRSRNYTNFRVKHKTVSRKKIVELYNILRKEYPKFEGRGVGREKIFKKLFPQEKYDDKKLRNIKYELSRIVELYLSYIDVVTDPVHQQIHLINQLEKRKLDKELDLNIDLTDELLKEADIMNEDYFYQRFLLSHKKRILNENRLNLGKSEHNFSILNEEINNISNFFFIILLKHLNLISHIKFHLNIDIKTEFYDYVYRYIRNHDEFENSSPLLLLLNKLLILHQGIADKKKIIEIRKLLNKYEKRISKTDLQYLYIDLLSFCIIIFSKGDISMKDILFEILKECMNKEVYVQGGYIHEYNYTSVVSLLLRLKDLELVEEFINKYKDKLLPEHRENAYLFNYANLNYVSKNYDKALEMLSKVKSKDFYYMTNIHNLQLRIYYETKSMDPALDLIDSYKHLFVTNKLIPREYKIRYKNFLKYYEELVKIKEGSSKYIPGLILEELKNVEEIGFKGWLTSKARELQKEIEK